MADGIRIGVAQVEIVRQTFVMGSAIHRSRLFAARAARITCAAIVVLCATACGSRQAHTNIPSIAEATPSPARLAMASSTLVVRGAERTLAAQLRMLDAIKRAIEQRPACNEAREARASLGRANSRHEAVARRGWLLLEGETDPACAGELAPSP